MHCQLCQLYAISQGGVVMARPTVAIVRMKWDELSNAKTCTVSKEIFSTLHL